MGPHRLKATVPLQVAAPPTVSVAESVDDAAEGVTRRGARALRGVGRREELEVTADRGVPAVDGDGRRSATVAEVADDQEVTVAVYAVEALGAADLLRAKADRVLEEPE